MKKNNKLIILLLIYAISVCLVCLFKFKVDPDYLWHIKAGEYMFKNGILTHDVFSWSLKGKYWMSHEWLFEIFVYFLKVIFGKFHMLIYCLLTSLSLMMILFFTNLKNLLKNSAFSLLWLSFSLLLLFYVQVRPHMISFSLMAVSIYVLYDLYKNENSKKIYILPFITIFWANVHGGSSNIPYLLCLLFLFCGFFNFKFNKIEANRFSKKQFLKYFIIMILCMICVCINIHGFKMFIYPYQNMLDKKMLDNIVEWKATSLNVLSNYIYILFVVFIFFILLISKEKIKFLDLVMFGFCVFLGMKSIRFWFYTYIIMSYIIFNYVGRYKDDGMIFKIGILIFSLFYIFTFAFSIKNFFPKQINFCLKEKDINYIKSLNSKKLFNMYNYGGDLVYNDIKVFIDGRADLYSGEIFNDYISISTLSGDFYSKMCKYSFDYYLVDKNYDIDFYLRYNNKFQLLYANGDVKVYKKMN